MNVLLSELICGIQDYCLIEMANLLMGASLLALAKSIYYSCGVDGRSLARSVYGHVITKFSGMGRLPHFFSYGAPPTRGAARGAPLLLGTKTQIQLFQKTLSEEKQKVFKPRPRGNVRCFKSVFYKGKQSLLLTGR